MRWQSSQMERSSSAAWQNLGITEVILLLPDILVTEHWIIHFMKRAYFKCMSVPGMQIVTRWRFNPMARSSEQDIQSSILFVRRPCSQSSGAIVTDRPMKVLALWVFLLPLLEIQLSIWRKKY